MAERTRSTSPLPCHGGDALARLAEYVRYVADRMNLRDWEFYVVIAPDSDDPARIVITPRRQIATIQIGPAFEEGMPQEQRHFIVHELVHAHLEATRSCLNTAERAMGAVAYDVMKANHDNTLESAVDALARAVAAGMPTPEQWATPAVGKHRR